MKFITETVKHICTTYPHAQVIRTGVRGWWNGVGIKGVNCPDQLHHIAMELRIYGAIELDRGAFGLVCLMSPPVITLAKAKQYCATEVHRLPKYLRADCKETHDFLRTLIGESQMGWAVDQTGQIIK